MDKYARRPLTTYRDYGLFAGPKGVLSAESGSLAQHRRGRRTPPLEACDEALSAGRMSALCGATMSHGVAAGARDGVATCGKTRGKAPPLDTRITPQDSTHAAYVTCCMRRLP
jgi:hypothetical protein